MQTVTVQGWGETGVYERYVKFDSVTGVIPAEFDSLYGAFCTRKGDYCVLVRLTTPEQPVIDFILLGVACDWLRDAGFVVDLTKVPGWKSKLGG